MSLKFNVRQIEHKTLHLEGQLSGEDLDIQAVDELISSPAPLDYDLTAELQNNQILVTGSLAINLRCECSRCLKPFDWPLKIEDWACVLPLEGEDAAPVKNDLVDLTPFLREDILLAFPQHPLCKPECRGLQQAPPNGNPDPSGAARNEKQRSEWAALDKLSI